MNPVNKRMLTAFIVILLYLTTGAFFYHEVEHWSYTDSIYVTGITLSTVGYGDFTPKTIPGKFFSIFLAFSGVGLVGLSIVLIGQKFLQEEIHHGVHKVLRSTGGFIRKEEREVERAFSKTLGVVKKEEHELAAYFKKIGIRDMQKKGHKR